MVRLPLTPAEVERGERLGAVLRRARGTRSMLQTDQRKPDVGSQSPSVETNTDGTTDVYFGPQAPPGKEGNWIQTVPGKGFFAILRLYSPLKSFFDRTWRPSEIENYQDK